MKKLVIIATVALAISGCSSKNEKGETTSIFGSSEIEKPVEDEGSSQIIGHPMIDNKQQLMGTVPLPANWKLHNEPGKAAFTGPGGIFVYNMPAQSFMYTNDPYSAQAYQQNGGKLRQFTSAADIVKQDLVPIFQRDGSKLINVTEMPNIARVDESVSNMLYTIGTPQKRYESVVSDWEDKDGNPFAVIVHLNGMVIGNATMWSYYCHGLNAPKDKYEAAKETLLYGLANIAYNPRYFDSYNQNEMNKESQSWAIHNQKMRNQQQQFDAQQAAHKEKWSAINDASMASYNARNAASDKNQNRFLNYIKDENTVVNPNDGKRYQVQSGSNQYYMDANGQYIGTNDPNYDPNRDPNNNNGTWQEAPTTD
ncbi:MAG: hypothetical protein EOO50_03905 [Flavobacterium sp.]|uniref:hypothetical protein n=1 Tax=Flavobacterium sp. TaxID=239 RepID=UPI0011F6442E|nr:hypothetical protein [Flavobacterium sp.]RZJ67979.1 MAG: hypothetical protein EOO50_03905 [Flavobacterium sp.]